VKIQNVRVDILGMCKGKDKQIKPTPMFCEVTFCALDYCYQVQSWESHETARKSKQYDLLNVLFVF